MQSGIKLISRIYLKLVLLQVAVGTLLRIVLLFNEQTSDISFTFGQWLKIFLLGAVNDWCALTIGFAVLWLFALSIAPGKYARRWATSSSASFRSHGFTSRSSIRSSTNTAAWYP